ncbi:MAG: hypothetical protein J6K39_02875 [Clostridia bacterium]|nr:hypothetical protein [Clostridia bacterium]
MRVEVGCVLYNSGQRIPVYEDVEEDSLVVFKAKQDEELFSILLDYVSEKLNKKEGEKKNVKTKKSK